MPTIEKAIHVQSREELIFLLAEAAEIEHNLMCTYLFAAFSLKDESDGLTADQAKVVAGWRRQIIAIAVEEMAHLALVANITIAIGGSPHFGRPNFPIAAGYHPSGIVVELHPFNRATLDHFIFLERPENVIRQDGEGFEAPVYDRNMRDDTLMPNARDYATVGHLYRGIRDALAELSERLGEDKLFIGDMSLQVGADLVNLPGLSTVKCLKTALAACDTIVEQGEGASDDSARCHYRRFLDMCEGFSAFEAAGVAPARPVADNPVMRKGPDRGHLWVDAPEAAAVMDLANAIYNVMLRCLAQGFSEGDTRIKRVFIDVAIDGMFALSPVATYLTKLPASTTVPDLNAGMSFATLRDVTPLPEGKPALAFVAERLEELAAGATRCLLGELSTSTQRSLAALAQKLRDVHVPPKAPVAGDSPSPAEKSGDPQATPDSPPAAVMPNPPSGAAENHGPTPDIEVAEGTDVIIEFEAKRCIHARYCVLQQPGVFKANVVGPWIAPDDADNADNLVAAALNCPSGAIQYRRKDGRPQETPPLVNLIRVRENGPNAFHGALKIDGEDIGTRATLCRCGRSQNKPFCDGSHKLGDDPFAATGEPATGDVTALEVRDGDVDIRPQKNGPLRVSGNLEVLSGTGRTIRKAQALMLCRCGHSGNKPFCDGSHARVGFVS